MIIDVLGSGESLQYWRGGADFTIAVNDASFYAPDLHIDAVAIVDRAHSIKHNRPRAVKTGLPTYCNDLAVASLCSLGIPKPSKSLLHCYNRGEIDLKNHTYHYRNGAIYAATVAMHLFAGQRIELRLWGVDIVTHPHLGKDADIVQQSVKGFKIIDELLKRQGGKLIVNDFSPFKQFFPMEENANVYKVPPGIGDLLWVAQCHDIPKDARILVQHGGPIGRATELLKLLGYNDIGEYHGKLSEAIELNTWLESGKRIEMKTGTANRALQFDLSSAGKIPAKKKDEKWIGVYASSEKMQKAWKGWNSETWAQFLDTLPDGWRVFYFGAEYDIDAPDGVDEDLRGKDLATTIKAIKRCDAFIGFASGIPILAEYFDVPTIMLCPTHLDKLQNTFCAIEKIGTAKWKACRFPTVKEMAKWCRDYKFFEQ